MRYAVITESEIGIGKKINQDSMVVKHALYGKGEMLMAIVCDGMGGLSKGEVASAAVIREFADWFERELPLELEQLDFSVIGSKWSLMLRNLNARIREYGQELGERLGTTFTGALFVNERFVVVHVGDTRLYHMDAHGDESIRQLTEDHTFVAREVLHGRLTDEQAKTDKRRHTLLQCVGASKAVEPQIIYGEIKTGNYLLCSDGFRNRVTEKELTEVLSQKKTDTENQMENAVKGLIKQERERGEKDDISVILIKISDKDKNKNENEKNSWAQYLRMETWEQVKYQWCGIGCLLISAFLLIMGMLCR